MRICCYALGHAHRPASFDLRPRRPDDHERLVERARAEDRSVSAELRLAIREHLRNGGLAVVTAGAAARDRRTHELVGQDWIERREPALEGTPTEVDARVRAAHDAKPRPARAQAARRVRGLHEIEGDLVPRGRGWFVSAGSDRIGSTPPTERPCWWLTRSCP